MGVPASHLLEIMLNFICSKIIIFIDDGYNRVINKYNNDYLSQGRSGGNARQPQPPGGSQLLLQELQEEQEGEDRAQHLA